MLRVNHDLSHGHMHAHMPFKWTTLLHSSLIFSLDFSLFFNPFCSVKWSCLLDQEGKGIPLTLKIPSNLMPLNTAIKMSLFPTPNLPRTMRVVFPSFLTMMRTLREGDLPFSFPLQISKPTSTTAMVGNQSRSDSMIWNYTMTCVFCYQLFLSMLHLLPW